MRTTSTPSLLRKFFLQGLGDAGIVELYVLRNTPARFRRLWRKRVKATGVGVTEWLIEVNYGTQTGTPLGDESKVDPGPNLGPAFSFDTTGQTIHVTQSLATISKSARVGGDTLGDAANNFTLDNNRAIGVTQDRVEGCEKYAPQFQWTIENSRLNCTGDYLTTLAALTGTTNRQQFGGFPAGSTLFMGATGRFTFDERWRVTYKFASLPNQTNIRVSDKIVVPAKAGWEYLWIGYTPERIGTRIFQTPDAAYVEKIYQSAEWWFLELGGPLPLDDSPRKAKKFKIIGDKDMLQAFQKRVENPDGDTFTGGVVQADDGGNQIFK